MTRLIATLLALIFAAPRLVAAQPLPLTEGISTVVHPEWARSANIYEVNIRQYTAEGTFRAFERHLPRLRRMGVEILWIMPVNPISKKMRKGTLGSYYATSDYKAVNPEFGTLDDFKHMVDTAHRLGFKIILDWVANHTGWDHVWVTTHPDWYKHNEHGELEGYRYTDLSDGHREVWSDVVGLDYTKPAVRAGMIDAMGWWLKTTGIDGFRCDVAWTVPTAFWDEARVELDKVKPVFMLAEADTPELHAHAFDMTYDWALYKVLVKVAQGQADARDIARLFTVPVRRYPEGAYRMTFTSNHDENSWKGSDRALYGDAVDVMTVLAMTLPGMPLIYSGQESGLDKRLAFFDKDHIVWVKYRRAKLYAKLLDIKQQHPALTSALTRGNLEIIETGNSRVFAFNRILGADRVKVVVNLSPEVSTVNLPGEGRTSLARWSWYIRCTSRRPSCGSRSNATAGY